MQDRKKIRWGIIGAGRIVRHWIRGAYQTDDTEIAVIASKSRSSAEKAAAELGIPEAADVDALLRRDDIDAVYIAVPNNAHKELALRALQAGKHVLVEKPAAVCEADFREMAECARAQNRFLMEAVWTRFFPMAQTLRELLDTGEIGEVRAVHSSFSYRAAPSGGNVRLFDLNRAGGSLLDVGVYNFHFADLIFDGEPEEVTGLASFDTDGLHIQVDEQTGCVARYSGGRLAVMTSGIRTAVPGCACIYGTKGYLVVPEFWRPVRIEIHKGDSVRETEMPVPQKNGGEEDEGYQFEIAHVNECIREGLTESPVMTWEKSLRVLRQCDALRREWGFVYPFERDARTAEAASGERQAGSAESGAAFGGEPLISVIIPVYNAERFLRETMDSLLSQTFRNFEILCIDDGSTDGSGEILAEYEARDPRIRVFPQKNGGTSRARNYGTCEAAGKYLYFLDHDDLLEREAFEQMADALERDQLEYLAFNAYAFADDDACRETAERQNRGYFRRELQEHVVYTGQELFRALKNDPDKSYISPAWACVVSRELILTHQIRFNPEILNEDEPWNFAVLMKVRRAGCLNRNLLRYRMHSSSLVRSASPYELAYSQFRCSQEIQKMISDPAFLREPGMDDVLAGHIVSLQRRAVGNYRRCSAEEKALRLRLPLGERGLFESLVVYPAETAEKLAGTRRQEQKKAERAEREIARLKKEKNDIRTSASFRIGRAATWLPRTIRKLFGRS